MAHKLPDLPYAYDALEPYIDEQTMRLHHDIHHAGYVTGLNNAEAKLAAARKADDYALVKHWSREAAFHGSGHLLHSIFWPNMIAASKAKAEPGGALAKAIDRDFGSFEAFKAQFVAASIAVEGQRLGHPGLSARPTSSLVILTAEKHQNLTQWGVVPCWCWTYGSTPTISSTRTAAASTSRTFSTSSTGMTSRTATKKHAASSPVHRA